MTEAIRDEVGGSEEAVFVARASSGDADAFAHIVYARSGEVFRLALAILGDEADARDATQEIFLRAWRNLPALQGAERFPAWFGRIVVNTCRSQLRGRRRRTVREIAATHVGLEAELMPRGGLAHDEVIAEQDLLDRAIDRLDVGQRTLLALHHLEHRPLREIGLLLGIPERTVKSRLFSARRALERHLEEERR